MAERRVIRELLVRLGVVTDGNADARLRAFDKGLRRVGLGAASMAANIGIAALSAKVLASHLGSRVFEANADRAARGWGLISSMALRAVDAYERFDAGIGLISRRTAEHARTLVRQAEALSLSTDELQQLQFAFREFDMTREDVNAALTRFSRQSHDALEKTGGAADEARRKFAKLGIAAEELKDRNPLQLLELVAHKLKNAPNQDRAIAGIYDSLGEQLGTVFGESLARRLIPALKGGAEGITELRRQARDLGLVIDRDLVESGRELATQWTTLKVMVDTLSNSLGLTLAPTITKVVRWVQEWIRENREIIKLRFEQAINVINIALERLHDLMNGINWNLVFAALLTTGAVLQAAATLLQVAAAAFFLQGTIQALRFVLALLPGSFLAASVAALKYAAAATVAFIASLPLSSALAVIAAVVAAILIPFAALVLLVEDLIVWFRGGQSAFGAWLELMDKTYPFLREVPGLLAALGRAFLAVAKLVGTVLLEAFMGFLDAVGVDLEELLKMLPDLMPIFEDIAEWIRTATTDVDAFTEKIDKLTESLKGMRDVVSNLLQGNFRQAGIAALSMGEEGGATPIGLLSTATASQVDRWVGSPIAAPAAAAPGGSVHVEQHNTFNGVDPSLRRELIDAQHRTAREALREGRVE